jgi:hypothetical protein
VPLLPDSGRIARPLDRRAWLLLFLMATFTDPFARSTHWEPGLRELGQAWRARDGRLADRDDVVRDALPERLRLDARFPGRGGSPRSARLTPCSGGLRDPDQPDRRRGRPGAILAAASVLLFAVGMAATSWFFISVGLRQASRCRGRPASPDPAAGRHDLALLPSCS